MTFSEIRATIQEFIAFVKEDAIRTHDDDSTLMALLDLLVVAQQFSGWSFDDSEYPEAPDQSWQTLRCDIAKRFPHFGYYNLPEHITQQIAISPCLVGDAIDDLADITGELQAVDWYWEHTSEMNALWHFRNGYQCHWQEHLRWLQLYIQSLASELGNSA